MNLLDSPWAIWLPSVANAFNIFLLKRFFDSIPKELLDAAADRRRVPAADPVVDRAADVPADPRRGLDLRGVAVWKDFLWPLLVDGYDPNRETLNVGIYAFSSGDPAERGIAASAMAAVPTHRVLPDLPAQHHVRPDRRQPQGLSTPASVATHDSQPDTSVRCRRVYPRKQLTCPTATGGRDWWRSAAIYQVYLRSFADGNGDGIGDLAGVRARLPYLAELGIDAIWFSPWYPSPMADAGYDVADYRDIDPRLRHPGRGRGADRRGARARASGSSSTSCRTTAPTSTRGSPPRWPRRPARPSGTGSGSGPAAASTASCRRTTGSRSSAARPGPGRPPRTARPGSGTCTCSRPSSPTSTGPTPRSAPSSRTCCGSGSTAASTASGSTRPRC